MHQTVNTPYLKQMVTSTPTLKVQVGEQINGKSAIFCTICCQVSWHQSPILHSGLQRRSRNLCCSTPFLGQKKGTWGAKHMRSMAILTMCWHVKTKWGHQIQQELQYCWCKKSCTSWYGKYPIIDKVLYTPGGAGFLPSTAVIYCIYQLNSNRSMKLVYPIILI